MFQTGRDYPARWYLTVLAIVFIVCQLVLFLSLQRIFHKDKEDAMNDNRVLNKPLVFPWTNWLRRRHEAALKRELEESVDVKNYPTEMIVDNEKLLVYMRLARERNDQRKLTGR